MINIFEFLYYCQYRMFALIKRVGEKDENLASFFYSVLLSTQSLTLLFFLRFIVPKGFFEQNPYNIILRVSLISVFFIWYFFCKYYFLKKENYKRIIILYEGKYPNKNSKIALIGIFYALLTFISFPVLAALLSKLH